MISEYKIYSHIGIDVLRDASIALYGNMLMNQITFYDSEFDNVIQISATEFCDFFLNNKQVLLMVKYKAKFLNISIDYQSSKMVITAIPKLKEQQDTIDLSSYIKCVLAICENFIVKEFFTEPYYSLPMYE